VRRTTLSWRAVFPVVFDMGSPSHSVAPGVRRLRDTNSSLTWLITHSVTFRDDYLPRLLLPVGRSIVDGGPMEDLI
jgi:hypothetical protein